MLFNSIEFIFAFLPITIIIYFTLTKYHKYTASKLWLFTASIFFYGWWNPYYITIILTSILINYSFSRLIIKWNRKPLKKVLLILGICFNLSLLGYYKYADFFIENINSIFKTDYNLLYIILPLGISFFTFQQIAFLIDSHKSIVKEYDFINYCVFVSFFPQLIAGPIVHHKEMMPQFKDKNLAHINLKNIAKGILMFNIGLAKKIIIADSFGMVANKGYGSPELLDVTNSWFTVFSYTMQLYFDFSGYSDMAIGLGLFFNIQIPVNFWSPMTSESIQQFYRRWHMTLSRFWRDYVYIPMGGNKSGEVRMYWNMLITFLIGGFWHGANWTFVIWGGLNGIAIITQKFYQRLNIKTPYVISVLITFLFVMIVRVYFRAENLTTANYIFKGLVGLQEKTNELLSFKICSDYYDLPLWIAGVVLLFGYNSNQILERFKTNLLYAAFITVLILLNLTFLNSVIKQDFLYFDF